MSEYFQGRTVARHCNAVARKDQLEPSIAVHALSTQRACFTMVFDAAARASIGQQQTPTPLLDGIGGIKDSLGARDRPNRDGPAPPLWAWGRPNHNGPPPPWGMGSPAGILSKSIEL